MKKFFIKILCFVGFHWDREKTKYLAGIFVVKATCEECGDVRYYCQDDGFRHEIPKSTYRVMLGKEQ